MADGADDVGSEMGERSSGLCTTVAEWIEADGDGLEESGDSVSLIHRCSRGANEFHEVLWSLLMVKELSKH